MCLNLKSPSYLPCDQLGNYIEFPSKLSPCRTHNILVIETGFLNEGPIMISFLLSYPFRNFLCQISHKNIKSFVFRINILKLRSVCGYEQRHKGLVLFVVVFFSSITQQDGKTKGLKKCCNTRALPPTPDLMGF